jgi:tRNA(adenine34) deaminase
MPALMDDTFLMGEALIEAKLAGAAGDVPVGAVAVRDGQIIARAHNQRETGRDPTAHAEMLVIREAARVLGGWRLVGVTIYCTLEPCPMCAGAMVQARLPELVYAVPDLKAGAAGSVLNLLASEQLNHRVVVRTGILQAEVALMMQEFFVALRRGQVPRWSRWAAGGTESQGSDGP